MYNRREENTQKGKSAVYIDKTAREVIQLIEQTQVKNRIDNTSIPDVVTLTGSAFVERNPQRLVEMALSLIVGQAPTLEEDQEARKMLTSFVDDAKRYTPVGSYGKAVNLVEMDENLDRALQSLDERSRKHLAQSIVVMAVLAHDDIEDFTASWDEVDDHFLHMYS